MKYLGMIIMLIWIQACRFADTTERASPFEEKVEDIVLSNIIKDYIKENHVDTLKSVVYITLNGCSDKKFILISNTIHNPFLFLDRPTGYTIMAGHPIVIFNNASISVPKKELQKEFNQRLLQFKIELENEFRSTYDPVEWHVTKSNSSLELNKHWNSSDNCE